MDAELKAKWITALRSGEYKQARGWLRRDDAFCCLGVLCDISGRGEWRGNQFNFPDDHRLGGLPVRWAKEIGVGQSAEAKLAAMNDARGASFCEIADWIEANL